MYRSREWILDSIRKDHRRHPDATLQQLAFRNRVSQRVVAEALSVPMPLKRKRARRNVLDPVKAAIDRILLQELDGSLPAGQSVTRIVERLRTEESFTRASYSTVRAYVQARRAALAEQEDRGGGPGR